MKEAVSSSDYIQHHLHSLHFNLKTMSLGDGGFWTVNVGTVVFSFVLGLLFLGVFFIAARKVTAGVPGKLQNFVEVLFS